MYTFSMPIKRIALFVLLSVVFILLAIELFSLYRDVRHLRAENDALEEKLSFVQDENEQIARDTAYYQDVNNLEKSLREKFNYKKPGETMIIIIPSQAE